MTNPCMYRLAVAALLVGTAAAEPPGEPAGHLALVATEVRPAPVALASALPAAVSAAAQSDWRFVVKPNLWGAGLDGNLVINDAGGPVDAEFDDLLGALDFGAMIGVEAGHRDSRWTLLFDGVFVDLGDDLENFDAEVDLTVVELDLVYRTGPDASYELLAGARYVDVTNEFSTANSVRSHDEDWIDPVIGMRGEVELGERAGVAWRSDIGGFGVGSDLSYQLGLLGLYDFSDSIRGVLGYRHLDIDYEDDDFTYDLATSGPVIGFSWSF